MYPSQKRMKRWFRQEEGNDKPKEGGDIVKIYLKKAGGRWVLKRQFGDETPQDMDCHLILPARDACGSHCAMFEFVDKGVARLNCAKNDYRVQFERMPDDFSQEKTDHYKKPEEAPPAQPPKEEKREDDLPWGESAGNLHLAMIKKLKAEPWVTNHDFLNSLENQINKGKKLSDKQVKALEDMNSKTKRGK